MSAACPTLHLEHFRSKGTAASEVPLNIPQLHVGAGTRLGPLTVFPVWMDAPGGLGISTGRHASISVAELPGGAQVGTLQATNAGTTPALLLEGELLEGGLQHRVCAADVVLAPGETRAIGAFCVEQGRWNGGSAHGRSARRAPLNVRSELHRPSAADGNRQGRVWARVAQYQGVAGRSATGSLVEHLDAGSVRRGGLSLPDPLEGQRGVVIGLGGQALLLEVFGTHTLFRRHWRQLLEGALMDTQLLGSAVPAVTTPGRAARSLVARAMTTDVPAPAPAGTLRSRAFAATAQGRSISGIAVARPHSPARVAHLTVWNTRHPYLLVA